MMVGRCEGYPVPPDLISLTFEGLLATLDLRRIRLHGAPWDVPIDVKCGL